jgi:hypothetical protein
LSRTFLDNARNNGKTAFRQITVVTARWPQTLPPLAPDSPQD